MAVSVILDCYTVEPSGLGVPPYLSGYVREAYAALKQAGPEDEIRYLTVDDVRWCLNNGRELGDGTVTDALTYSATLNRNRSLELLSDAAVVVVIAGDKVPSVHLHAVNGSLEDIVRALACVRGKRVLVGPLASYVLAGSAEYAGLFDACHTHTVTGENLLTGSTRAADYERLRAQRGTYDGLVDQFGWRCIAEIELYRGCTRRVFCSFCNEPAKNLLVDFRSIEDVVEEMRLLHDAGVRDFRLGQQTCFFSYMRRDAEAIRRLLAQIREACPDLSVLHIDNADPLAVASPAGARIAKVVAEYCTEGNCAPMGVESFDPAVIARNNLTCTPDIVMRAIDHLNAAGAGRGPHGLPRLLPGINLVYGLPGETHRSHVANMQGLTKILDAGHLCHRTNVRQVRAYPGTPLFRSADLSAAPSVEHFTTWKADIGLAYEVPMKQRVYPAGVVISGLESSLDEHG
jgi:radical SAM superfamily enzyme with C-terminal helix-hairpin-helix motif